MEGLLAGGIGLAVVVGGGALIYYFADTSSPAWHGVKEITKEEHQKQFSEDAKAVLDYFRDSIYEITSNVPSAQEELLYNWGKWDLGAGVARGVRLAARQEIITFKQLVDRSLSSDPKTYEEADKRIAELGFYYKQTMEMIGQWAIFKEVSFLENPSASQKQMMMVGGMFLRGDPIDDVYDPNAVHIVATV